MFKQRRKFVAACVALGMVFATGGVQAADYPERPIQLVVPFPAGGATDVLARILAKRITLELGQTVVVENRAGAGTIVGAQHVARSAPDGYTLLMTSGTTFAVNPAIYKKLPFDPEKDFEPVRMLARSAMIIVANPNEPYSDLKGLVRAAKQAGDKFAYGSFGMGTTSHFAAEMFQQAAGTHMLHVPYRGSSPAVTDLIGGQIPILFDSLVSSIPHIKSGKVKPIAVTTAERSSFLPDVPTIAESGYPSVAMDTWVAWFFPSGVSADIHAKLGSAISTALKDEEVQTQMRASGFEMADMDGAAVSAIIAQERPSFAELAKRAGIEAQ